jgi:hypothetical protein
MTGFIVGEEVNEMTLKDLQIKLQSQYARLVALGRAIDDANRAPSVMIKEHEETIALDLARMEPEFDEAATAYLATLAKARRRCSELASEGAPELASECSECR